MNSVKYFSQSYKTKKGAQLRADFENKRARPGVSQYNYSIASEGKGKGWRLERSVINGKKR